MSRHQPERPKKQVQRATRRIGCVSYLNSKPLIDTLDDHHEVKVRYDVPARLFEDLAGGAVDIALCPVVDLHRREAELCVVPSGGIGCFGSTLTVRLYSQVPIEQIEDVYADTESHTSVALMRVLMHRLTGRLPGVIDYHAREHVAEGRIVEQPRAMLLIGDKVVTDSPPAVTYPHQLDLGEAWCAQTGLPFVFAVWMARVGDDLGTLPELLTQTRRRNKHRIDAIAAHYAPIHGWPLDLARQYLGKILHYKIGPRQLEAIERFSDAADALGLLPHRRALRLYEP